MNQTFLYKHSRYKKWYTFVKLIETDFFCRKTQQTGKLPSLLLYIMQDMAYIIFSICIIDFLFSSL